MSISNYEQWLRDAGYEYQCFISYPRIKDPSMRDCAHRVKEAIENDLSHLISEPKVFLDTNIMGGTDWEKHLRSALCRSIAMVALCAPIYYHPKHEWCGLEWAAMESLCEKRLPGRDVRTIIPLIVRISTPLPAAVSKVQYIDISQLMLTRGYYKTIRFLGYIRQVVSLIDKVANAIVENQALADCEQFEIPPESAFLNWLPSIQPPPFRSTPQ